MIPETKLILGNLSKDVLTVPSHIYFTIFMLGSCLHSIFLYLDPFHEWGHRTLSALTQNNSIIKFWGTRASKTLWKNKQGDKSPSKS